MSHDVASAYLHFIQIHPKDSEKMRKHSTCSNIVYALWFTWYAIVIHPHFGGPLFYCIAIYHCIRYVLSDSETPRNGLRANKTVLSIPWQSHSIPQTWAWSIQKNWLHFCISFLKIHKECILNLYGRAKTSMATCLLYVAKLLQENQTLNLDVKHNLIFVCIDLHGFVHKIPLLMKTVQT